MERLRIRSQSQRRGACSHTPTRRWLLAFTALCAWAAHRLVVSRPVTRYLFTRRAQRAAGLEMVAGGGRVPYRRWDAAVGTGVAAYAWDAAQPRAAVLLAHGIGDYSERHVFQNHALIQRLLEHNVSVYAFDQWGAGRSPGVHGATDVAQAVDDHLAARRAIATEQPEVPVFAIGISLGGLIALTSALREQRGLAGVIVLSPAIHYPVPSWIRWLAQAGAWLFPMLPVPLPMGDPSALTRLPDMRERFDADPGLYRGMLPWNVAGGVARISNANWATYPTLRVPLLALHGTADRGTDPGGSERLIAVSGSTDRTLHRIEGGYHALLDDAARDEALRVLLDWLEEHIPRTDVAQQSIEA